MGHENKIEIFFTEYPVFSIEDNNAWFLFGFYLVLYSHIIYSN